MISLSSSVEKKVLPRARREKKKTVEGELNMLPLCVEKKRGQQRDDIERPRLVSNEYAHFFFILSNAHIELLPARSRSLSAVCYFSRKSSGRKEVVVVVESLNTTFRFYTRSL